MFEETKIIHNGVEYPVNLNMLVFSKWEMETGKKITEIGAGGDNIGAREAIEALLIIYFGIADGCEEQGIEFNYTQAQFLRSVNMRDMEKYFKLIQKGISGDSDLDTKKRHPKLAKKK